MGRRGIRIWALGVVVTLAVALAACSDDDDRDITLVTDPPRTTSTSEGSTTTADSTTTTDPDAELKAEVEAAYLAQWDAYLAIFGDPDPANPLIGRTYTGEALDAALDGVTERFVQGQAWRLPDDRDGLLVKVLSVELHGPHRATVRACVIDDLILYDVVSEEVINDTVVTDIDTAEMELEDGRWKLASGTYDTQEGNPGCDEM